MGNKTRQRGVAMFNTHKEMSTIIAFKIGRGGRFNNQGHLSCLGETRGIGYLPVFDELYPHRCVDDEYDLVSPRGEYTDGNGNGVGLFNADVECGIGRIDIDGEYESYYTKYADDLDEVELALINEAMLKLWRILNYYKQIKIEQ